MLLQSGVNLLHKLSGLAEAPLGHALTDLPVVIIRWSSRV